MDKNTLNSIAIIGVVILGIVSIYFGFKKEPVDDSYFRSTYINGCVSESNYAFCSCSYESLKSQLGVEGLLQFAVEYESTGVLPKEAYTAISECMEFSI